MKYTRVFWRICLFVFLIGESIYFYSPIGVSISPLDEETGMAAISILNGVVSVILLICGNKMISLMKKERKQINFSGAHTSQEVKTALEKMQGETIFKEIISAAIKHIQKSNISKINLEKTITDSFPKGSLSWSKYYDIVNNAEKAIVENGMTIAKRLEQFDENEFYELRKIIKSGEYKKDDIPDDIQEEKMELYTKKLNLIYELLNNNERLLLKLDRLDAELLSISDKNIDHGNELLLEINTLIEETKYYK